jgi:hypothetical protein
MGNCCSPSTDHVINDFLTNVLSSLPIKHKSIKTLNEDFNNFTKYNDDIAETEFQELMNTYLLDPNNPHNINYNLVDLWLNFYKAIPCQNRKKIIQFCLSMLSKCDDKTEIINLDNHLIKPALTTYIALISFEAAEHFKNYKYTPENFWMSVQDLWCKEALPGFIEEHFFKDTGNEFESKSFYKEHCDYLKNDEKIRIDFAEFSIKYKNEYKSFLGFSELSESTNSKDM